MTYPCIFSCDSAVCHNKFENAVSFHSILCPVHLKNVFGLSIFYYKQEPQDYTEISGPFLTPEENFSFKPYTVLFPERSFLDQYLAPELASTTNVNYFYELNPRMKTFYHSLITSKNNKTSKYQYELLRNLFITDSSQVQMMNEQNEANVSLRTHIQNRLASLYNFIKNEPYYKLFKNIEIVSIDNVSNVKTLQDFSPFYAFLLFNTLYDQFNLPIPSPNSPLFLYGNLVYKDGVGFCISNQVTNPNLLVTHGNVKSTLAYYQIKTHKQPKKVANTNTRLELPANARQVTNDNVRFCNYFST